MKFDPEAFEATVVNQRNQTEYVRELDCESDRTPAHSAEALQIKATSGLGKTSTAIKLIASDPYWRDSEVIVYVANRDQAAEVAEIARGYGLRPVVIYGRNPDPDSPGYCARHQIAEKAAKVGLRVYQTCCQTFMKNDEITCPYYGYCPYLRQWADDKPALRIMNQIYAFLPRPSWGGAGLPDPLLVVVDESVLNSSIVAHLLEVDDLDEPFKQAVCEHWSNGKDLKTALEEAGVDALLALEYEAICRNGEQNDIIPTTDEKTARKVLNDARDRKVLQKAAFYRAIACELQFDRPIHGIDIAEKSA